MGPPEVEERRGRSVLSWCGGMRWGDLAPEEEEKRVGVLLIWMDTPGWRLSGRAVAVGAVQGRMVSKQSDRMVGAGRGGGGVGWPGGRGGGSRGTK